MISNRGGWAVNLQDIIIALICLVILLIATGFIVKTMGETVEKEECKKWVSMKSFKIKGYPLTEKVGDYSCVTDVVRIEDADKNDIYTILANEMYDCWDMYGRGKIDFYSDWDWSFGDTHCRVCDKIIFEKPFELNTDDFEEYLSTINPYTHNESYSEFFTEAKNAKLDFGQGTINLNKGDSLLTLFTIKKSSEIFSKEVLKDRLYDAGAGVIITTAVGGVVGFFVPLPGTTLAGAKLGFILGNAIVAAETAGRKSYFYPGLLLINNEDLLEQGCSDYYINVEEEEKTIV